MVVMGVVVAIVVVTLHGSSSGLVILATSFLFVCLFLLWKVGHSCHCRCSSVIMLQHLSLQDVD